MGLLKGIFIFIILGVIAWGVAGCGQLVEVPPANVGKVLTKNGFLPETISPSKFRLPYCIFYCDTLVTADASDLGIKEVFSLYMPKDQLNMQFDARMIIAIKTDEKSINSIYNRVPAKDRHIGILRVYETYVKPIVRDTVRTTMADYSINKIASSRAYINAEIGKALDKALANAPITVRRIGLADIQFPAVITKQKEKAAQRRIEIEEAEAKKQIALVELQTELEKAKAQRGIRRERAEAAREENAIFSASVNDKYLAYKRLEVLEAMAKNPNTVFIPLEALGQLGLSQRLFSKKE